MPETAKRVDPFPTYRFAVSIQASKVAGGGDDLPIAEFSECSGLEMTVKFEEVREGGLNEYVHKLPGRVEYGNLTLRRGYARSNEFYKWCQTVFNRKKIERKNVVVKLIQAGQDRPIVTWTFRDAYPVKWSGPQFKAGDSAVAIESLEIAHAGFEVE